MPYYIAVYLITKGGICIERLETDYFLSAAATENFEQAGPPKCDVPAEALLSHCSLARV